MLLLVDFCVNKIFASRNQFSYGLYHLLVGLKSGLHYIILLPFLKSYYNPILISKSFLYQQKLEAFKSHDNLNFQDAGCLFSNDRLINCNHFYCNFFLPSAVISLWLSRPEEEKRCVEKSYKCN